MRSNREVFDDHLATRSRGHQHIEEDIERNYHDDVVVVSNYGTFYGKDGVRQSAAILKSLVPPTAYEFPVNRVAENTAHLEWRVPGVVEDGVDWFLFEGGKIKLQFIYYTVSPVS